MGIQTDGRTDGLTDIQMDGWLNEWRDGRAIVFLSHTNITRVIE